MRKLAVTILLLLLIPISVLAWGEKGHLMINHLAIEAAASQLPEFMNAAREQLTYDGPEPDRWRDEVNTTMSIDQAPDHFFDSELWGPISTIEKDRYAFMEKVAAKKVPLIKIGYLPYAILDMYGRLRSAFRQWRAAKTPEDRESARMNAIVYAGLLGHYVGDGSMPMHLSINYNGWDANTPNPNNYTRDNQFHSRYETVYVNKAIDIAHVRPLVKAPHRLPDVFAGVKDYLTQTFNEVEPTYQMEKTGEFNPDSPKTKGTEWISGQLARAATMLGDLWYTAWMESGEPARQPARP